MKKHFSNIHAQVIAQSLKEFKDIHAITDRGILGIKAGEILYDVITGEYDIEEDVPNVVLSVTAEEKKVIWENAKTHPVIQVQKTENKKHNKEFKDKGKPLSEDQLLLQKEQLKALLIEVYKTLLVEHHLNILANNGQFVEINLPLKII